MKKQKKKKMWVGTGIGFAWEGIKQKQNILYMLQRVIIVQVNNTFQL